LGLEALRPKQHYTTNNKRFIYDDDDDNAKEHLPIGVGMYWLAVDFTTVSVAELSLLLSTVIISQCHILRNVQTTNDWW